MTAARGSRVSRSELAAVLGEAGVVSARFPGSCGECGERWAVGTPIRRLDSAWVHAVVEDCTG